MLATESPFPQYFELNGSPLDAGKLYFGLPNQDPETNPIPVYWDAAGTQPAVQPIRTMNGYTARAGTPANVFVDGDYSINVRNKKGELLYYAASSAEFSNDARFIADLADTTDPTKGDAMVGVKQPFPGAIGRTQHDKNAETLSSGDFGVPTDGIADASATLAAADAAAAAAGLPLTIMPGRYKVTANMTFASFIIMSSGARIVSAGTNWFKFWGGFDAPMEFCLDIAGYTNFRKVQQLIPQWFGAAGDAVVTSASIPAASTALTLQVAPGGVTPPFVNGDTMFVNGAGLGGGVLATTIVSGGGTLNLVLSSAAVVTANPTAASTRDDTVAMRRFFNAFKGAGNTSTYGTNFPSTLGCSKAYLPGGTYATFGKCDQWDGTLTEGVFSNVQGGAVIMQCNIAEPSLNMIADNLDENGNSINGGNGNNIVRHLGFKSAYINDNLINSPNLFYQNAWNNHSDNQVEHCTFQNTASAGIGAGFRTTGSINAGTNSLTLVNGSTFRNGNNPGGQLTIKGAGVAGADLVTYIVSGGGTNNVVLNDNASTTVAAANVYPTVETCHIKIRHCEWDVCRAGVDAFHNVSVQLWFDTCQFFMCVRGAVRCLLQSTVVGAEVLMDNCHFSGCGNPFNAGDPNYRDAIHFDCGNPARGELTIRNSNFYPLTNFGGSVWAQCDRFIFQDNSTLDQDSANLAKMIFMICNKVKINDNFFISTVLQSYVNARLVVFSNPAGFESWDTSGNSFINLNASAIEAALQSDYTLSDGIAVNNHFKGNFTTAMNPNIATTHNQIVPNFGFGPTWRPGGAAAATQTWKVGDIVWNTAVANAAGSPVGFVCVVAGTPGTWRPFGVTT